MPKAQSAYCQYRSSETVPTMVYNDMLMAADGQVSVCSTHQQPLTQSTTTC